MSVANEEAICATDAVARAAAEAYIDATALVAAIASVHETKKTAEEARQTMLGASRVAEAFAQDVQQKVIAFDINAFECSTVMQLHLLQLTQPIPRTNMQMHVRRLLLKSA